MNNAKPTKNGGKTQVVWKGKFSVHMQQYSIYIYIYMY